MNIVTNKINMIKTNLKKHLWFAYIEDIADEINDELSNINQQNQKMSGFLKYKIKDIEADIDLEKNSACDFLKHFGCSPQTENKLKEIVKNELIMQIKHRLKLNVNN